MSISEKSLYHSLGEQGHWTGSPFTRKDFSFLDLEPQLNPIPIGFQERNGQLMMIFSTFEGNIPYPVDNISGMRVVKGDSKAWPQEEDEELLIEIHYLKEEEMELATRRIRQTGIKFGIFGGTEREDVEKGSHRAMGESADFYLEGEHTIYPPGENAKRRFPFWRLGVYGSQINLIENYMPVPDNWSQSKQARKEIDRPDLEICLTELDLEDSMKVFKLIDRNREHLSQHGDNTAAKYPDMASVIDSIIHPHNTRRVRFGIRNPKGIYVGTINITLDEENSLRAEVGYYLGAEFVGNGYMAKALQALEEYAFNQMGIEELYGEVHENNQASSKVLIKAGFSEGGRKDNHVIFSKNKGKN